MHQVVAAEVGTEFDRTAQDIDAPLPDGTVDGGDREARRRGQQPVQTANGDPGVGAGAADSRPPRRRHTPCVVAQGEGRDLKAAIAEPCRQHALALEWELADHLIAQGQFHR